ncbi:MAG: type II toxin-antitoxin system Phd/YefM family antitoxin [Spirochaetales bacterium]|nr:type II toxin-antitoxin system Phd/YefM family antitoxin [Spirochaetales bacterium]
MIQVTIHEAKTHLSRLIKLALSGEEVIIAKGKKPLVKISPLPNVRIERKIGTQKNLIIKMDDDFNEPLKDFTEYME